MDDRPGRRFSDPEFFALRDKFYEHMRDEEIKTLQYNVDHTAILKELREIKTDIAPVVQDKKDKEGAMRVSTKRQKTFRYIVFWPLAFFGLIKAMDWLVTHFPKLFGTN